MLRQEALEIELLHYGDNSHAILRLSGKSIPGFVGHRKRQWMDDMPGAERRDLDTAARGALREGLFDRWERIQDAQNV